jgi:hypothetical protein
MRQLQAEVLGASWGVGAPDEQSQAATPLGANIQTLIAQFQFSAGQNPSAGLLVLSPQFAGGSTRELGAVIAQIAGGHLAAVNGGGSPSGRQPSQAIGVTLAPVHPQIVATPSSEASGAAGQQGVLSSITAPSATSEPIGAIRSAGVRSSRVANGLATVRPIPVATRPAVRAAVGTATSASAPPTVALLALVTLCLLPVMSLGRLGLDPFSFKSAQLTWRLERPG